MKECNKNEDKMKRGLAFLFLLYITVLLWYNKIVRAFTKFNSLISLDIKGKISRVNFLHILAKKIIIKM
ncbi:hypothetical protein DIX61_03095 [Streptococcus iniae]|uniref:Uncharacterized protein n=1 Tax=Streptococcus iniae TaxID=1346 RepID=A0A3L8GHU4_STRIN|nr:hypothetical protein DQ08_03765 [Streptococcus iniae]EKB52520.1 hypothetical protein A0G_0355 [Streptococcus iniae 9117]ESR10647.1 hypothetical protein IUSA1_00655 [Streptococcus iniae IUSA1]AHY17459.1 hypothetical protein DW64_03760 [Streptococcus iniae]AJG25766.1 hypothetical protein SI82_04005 [Streptococcus iniae]